MTLSLATVLLFASLGLVALAIGLLARRYSRPAMGVGLAGLLTLTTASTWLTWAGTGTTLDLRSKLAETERDLDMARSETSMLVGRLKLAEQRGAGLTQAEEELVRLRGEREALSREVTGARQRTAAAEGKITELLRQLQSAPATPTQPGAAADGAAREKIAGLERDLARARNDLVAAEQQLAREREGAARLNAEMADGRQRLSSAEARAAELTRQLRGAPAQAPQVSPGGEKVAGLERELDRTRGALNAAQQQTSRDRDSIARLNADLANERATAQQRPKNDGVAARLQGELSAARAEIERLKPLARNAAPAGPGQPGVVPRATPFTTGPAPAAGVADEWRQRLSVRLPTPRFVTEPMRAQELVTGLKGGWYVVRLEQGGRPLRFDNRRFRKPEAVPDIVETARSLDRELLNPLRASGRPVRLFVRGSADARGYAGTDEVPEQHHVIGYLPRGRDGRFATGAREQRAGSVVRNRDLPNLRADWVREQIGPELKSLDGREIGILENPPAPGRDRTVELVLYVGW